MSVPTLLTGGFLAIDCITQEAVFSSRDRFRVLKRWPSFEEALVIINTRNRSLCLQAC